MLKTENSLSAFVAVGLVNNEIFMSLLNFLFTNKQINVNNLTFCFSGKFFWVPTPVNRYEICSGYGPVHTISFKTKWTSIQAFEYKNTKHVHADGLKECLENAFQCIGIVPLYQHLENLIVGGASIKLVLHSDLGV